MSLATLMTRDVTILTPGTTVDRYGDTIADWSTTTSRTSKAWLAQQTAVETHDHRDATSTTLAATFPLTAALTAHERVVVDAVTYDIEGEPNVARTPTGPHHVEVLLRAAVG